jgi:hypothetical protein
MTLQPYFLVKMFMLNYYGDISYHDYHLNEMQWSSSINLFLIYSYFNGLPYWWNNIFATWTMKSIKWAHWCKVCGLYRMKRMVEMMMLLLWNLIYKNGIDCIVIDYRCSTMFYSHKMDQLGQVQYRYQYRSMEFYQRLSMYGRNLYYW